MGHSCENAMPIKIEEDACGKVCCWCHTGTHQYKNRYTHKHSHCIANARKTKATISVVFARCVKNKYSKVGYIKKKSKCCSMWLSTAIERTYCIFLFYPFPVETVKKVVLTLCKGKYGVQSIYILDEHQVMSCMSTSITASIHANSQIYTP